MYQISHGNRNNSLVNGLLQTFSHLSAQHKEAIMYVTLINNPIGASSFFGLVMKLEWDIEQTIYPPLE